MSAMNAFSIHVDHCSNCGQVYQVHPRKLCLDCRMKNDSELRRCHDYMIRNRKADVQELSLKTAVPERQIMLWIKEGRLAIGDYPHLGYCCELCSTIIRTGKLCTDCGVRIHRDVRLVLAKEKAPEKNSAGERHVPERKSTGAWHSSYR